MANGRGVVPEFVFINEVGKMVDGDNLRRRVFNPALAKAGLRKVRIHDLRTPSPVGLSSMERAWPM